MRRGVSSVRLMISVTGLYCYIFFLPLSMRSCSFTIQASGWYRYVPPLPSPSPGGSLESLCAARTQRVQVSYCSENLCLTESPLTQEVKEHNTFSHFYFFTDRFSAGNSSSSSPDDKVLVQSHYKRKERNLKGGRKKRKWRLCRASRIVKGYTIS